jgi:GTPase SAR1 family protein
MIHEGGGEDQREYKILLLGQFGVGKSSLTLRCTENQFSEDEQVTLGENAKGGKKKTIIIGKKKVILSIYDTEGYEAVREINPEFIRQKSDGVILVFDG